MAITVNGVVLGAAPVAAVSSRCQPPSSPDVLNLQRSTFLARRLRAALSDLCARVPEFWLTPTPNGIDFETLTIRQCDRLVRSLEDAARALEEGTRKPHSVVPDRNQLSLFGSDL